MIICEELISGNKTRLSHRPVTLTLLNDSGNIEQAYYGLVREPDQHGGFLPHKRQLISVLAWRRLFTTGNCRASPPPQDLPTGRRLESEMLVCVSGAQIDIYIGDVRGLLSNRYRTSPT